MKLIKILGIDVKLIEEVESPRLDDESTKKFTDSVTIRNLHLESSQVLHTRYTDIQNRIIFH